MEGTRLQEADLSTVSEDIRDGKLKHFQEF